MAAPAKHPDSFPEERRLATILFADVQGFTQLAEHLDYETISDLIKDIWYRLDAIIEQNGGYIDKHMGDGVMAIWGAPFASDKDAENAVNAALELTEAVNRYTSKSEIPGVDKLKLRVGLNSGHVFAGYVGTKHEYTVLGDNVNIATRLEQAAEAGTVLIGEGTYHLVRNNFKLHAVPPIIAKGKMDPVLAYQVEGKQDTGWKITYESLDRLETHMVARENEITRLKSYYDLSRSMFSPLMTLVTGEVGIGKSRLLMEFARRLEHDNPDAQVVSVRALAQMSRMPFYIWRLVFFQLFGLQQDAPSDRTARKFDQEVTRLWRGKKTLTQADEVAHSIGKLINIEFPDMNRNRLASDLNAEEETASTFEQARELLNASTKNKSLTIIIDDLQWADRESLNLLAFLLEPGSEPLPMLVVAGARLNLLRDHPKWWAMAPHLITLGPLPVTPEIVMAAYPDLKTLPLPVLGDLAARAEGNPFFLEEIVKSILQAGLPDFKANPEEAIHQLQSQIPESLRATLQARLDNLSREARSVALMASVIGRVFWVGALKAVARVNTGTGTLTSMPELVMDRLIQDGLRQLVRSELAFPRAGTKFDDTQEYIFKNSYLRDVAYSLLPHRSRSIYHRAVGRWLSGYNETSFKVMAAEHYEKAGVFFDAVEQYESALDLARTRGSQTEIEALSQRAREAREAGRKAAQYG